MPHGTCGSTTAGGPKFEDPWSTAWCKEWTEGFFSIRRHWRGIHFGSDIGNPYLLNRTLAALIHSMLEASQEHDPF